MVSKEEKQCIVGVAQSAMTRSWKRNMGALHWASDWLPWQIPSPVWIQVPQFGRKTPDLFADIPARARSVPNAHKEAGKHHERTKKPSGGHIVGVLMRLLDRPSHDLSSPAGW